MNQETELKKLSRMQPREIEMENMKRKLTNLEYKVRRPNIYLTRIPEKAKGTEGILKEMMAENIPELKDTNP